MSFIVDRTNDFEFDDDGTLIEVSGSPKKTDITEQSKPQVEIDVTPQTTPKRAKAKGSKKNQNLEAFRMRPQLREVFLMLVEEGVISDKSKYLNNLVRKDLERRGYTFDDLVI